MDFSDIYADFLEAVKLPDEAQMASDIQANIDAYYKQHGPGGNCRDDSIPTAFGPRQSGDRKSTRMNCSNQCASRIPSSACNKNNENTQSSLRCARCLGKG